MRLGSPDRLRGRRVPSAAWPSREESGGEELSWGRGLSPATVALCSLVLCKEQAAASFPFFPAIFLLAGQSRAKLDAISTLRGQIVSQSMSCAHLTLIVDAGGDRRIVRRLIE